VFELPNSLNSHFDTARARGFEPSGYRPGAVAAVIGAHMAYYAPAWGFGAVFEAKLAREMGAFLERFDPAQHLFVCLWQGDDLAGSITIDGDDPEGPHLRWFITSGAARGKGIGSALMGAAMAFTDALGKPKPAWLTTFAGLDAAERLYLKHGFRLTHEADKDQWQGGVRERWYHRPAP